MLFLFNGEEKNMIKLKTVEFFEGIGSVTCNYDLFFGHGAYRLWIHTTGFKTAAVYSGFVAQYLF